MSKNKWTDKSDYIFLGTGDSGIEYYAKLRQMDNGPLYEPLEIIHCFKKVNDEYEPLHGSITGYIKKKPGVSKEDLKKHGYK